VTRIASLDEHSLLLVPEHPDQQALTLHAIMAERRSIRRLRPGPFTDEMRERLLTAVRLTPAAYNLPPWRVVLIHRQRAAFWAEVERGFRETLHGDQLDRYLDRLRGFAPGVAVALVFVDREVERALREERGAAPDVAASFVQQAMGMVQLAVWLAVTAEGMATSLQHWDHLVGPRIARFAGLPENDFGLVATMPIGYADGPPRPIERAATEQPGTVDPRRA
jgi:predicted oxidoreductase (fatty acid repression mutant protein)